MKQVLVTGGAGFIGANYVRYLLSHRRDINVVVLDALTYAGNIENLHDVEGYHFIQGDICDGKLVDSLFATYNFDLVVHFAAESHVDRSIYGPAAFVETNIIGTFVLLETARKHWVGEFGRKRFHHVSTDEVFGTLSPAAPAFREDTAYDPRSPYSASKAASDHLVRAYFHTYDLPVSLSNCSNNYGPYQFPEKLIPVVITSCLEGEPIPVYGDGMQIRDWLYVEDHCQAIQKIVEEGDIGETYNIGGGNQTPNIEITKMICSLLDEKVPNSPYIPHENLIAHVNDRPGHDRRYAINSTKISNELRWEPNHDLSSGMEKTVEWYLNNRDWVNRSLKRGQ